MAKKLLVGRILKPIGLKGLVKIQSYMSSSEIFLKQTTFFDSNDEKINVTKLQHLGDDKFSGFINNISSCDDADKYRRCELHLPRNSLPPLSNNEYYYDDLIGMKVYDENDTSVGMVKIALDYGAGTFLEVVTNSSENSTKNGKTVTIPFNKNAIIDVNLELNKIIVNKNYIL